MELEYISLSQAQEMIELLACQFDIPIPKVKIHRTIKNKGYAHYRNNTITISLWTDRFKHIDTLLHEFSHLLSYKRHGKNGIGHGELFRTTLLEVVKIWYKDINLYEWSKEYRSINKWYDKKYR